MLAVAGYPDMASAADAAPGFTAHQPTACEGLDSRITDVVRAQRGAGAVDALPPGSGWLFTEFAAGTAAEAEALARRALADAGTGATGTLLVTDPWRAAVLWRIREDGAGFAGRSPDGQPAYPGWEDSAVPPGELGCYLRELEELMRQYRLTGPAAGHFGDGCLHLRLDFPLGRPDGPRIMRAFMTDAARLVARYGGSLSGEHGDGSATAASCCPSCTHPAILDLFGQVKAAFDPRGTLNPGILTDPSPLDAGLRARGAGGADAGPRGTANLALAYRHDHGDFGAAVHRCTGIGKCRADLTGSGGVMCPSYLATRDEEHSTRGRARVLQEMVTGTLVTGGWRDPAVHGALDLCLACKACARECPAGVDLASYKAEVLYQGLPGPAWPRSHYALGWLPRWARLASLAPARPARRPAPRACPARRRGRRGSTSAASCRLRPPPLRGTSRSPGRPPPRFTAYPCCSPTRSPATTPRTPPRRRSACWGRGHEVPPTSPAAAARSPDSTGQLGTAKRKLRRTAALLPPRRRDPDVGLSRPAPRSRSTRRSCRVGRGGAGRRSVRTLPRCWPPWTAGAAGPGLHYAGGPAVRHHNAVLGWDADEALLHRAGAELTRSAVRGLADNPGVERGHYEVSGRWPAPRCCPRPRSRPGRGAAGRRFSRRTQLADRLHGPAPGRAARPATRPVGDGRPAPRHRSLKDGLAPDVAAWVSLRAQDVRVEQPAGSSADPGEQVELGRGAASGSQRAFSADAVLGGHRPAELGHGSAPRLGAYRCHRGRRDDVDLHAAVGDA